MALTAASLLLAGILASPSLEPEPVAALGEALEGLEQGHALGVTAVELLRQLQDLGLIVAPRAEPGEVVVGIGLDAAIEIATQAVGRLVAFGRILGQRPREKLFERCRDRRLTADIQ